MTAEAAVAAGIDRLLKARGAYAVNVTGTGVGRNGIADRLVCFHGAFLAIEIKGSSGRATKLQEYELERVRAAGGRAIVARSVNDVRALLDHIEEP